MAPRTRFHDELDGRWLSRYTYHSSGRNQTITVEHPIVLRDYLGRVVGEDYGDDRSHIQMDMQGRVRPNGDEEFIGRWEEQTALNGYYRGATFSGQIHLLYRQGIYVLAGKWTGVSRRDDVVNAGDWTLTAITRQVEEPAGAPEGWELLVHEWESELDRMKTENEELRAKLKQRG